MLFSKAVKNISSFVKDNSISISNLLKLIPLGILFGRLLPPISFSPIYNSVFFSFSTKCLFLVKKRTDWNHEKFRKNIGSFAF